MRRCAVFMTTESRSSGEAPGSNKAYGFCISPRKDSSTVAKLWAQEIMFAETMEDAKALYERCPRLLKEKVKAILIKSGFEEITQ